MDKWGTLKVSGGSGCIQIMGKDALRLAQVPLRLKMQVPHQLLPEWGENKEIKKLENDITENICTPCECLLIVVREALTNNVIAAAVNLLARISLIRTCMCKIENEINLIVSETRDRARTTDFACYDSAPLI